jgi:hypothetical protein
MPINSIHGSFLFVCVLVLIAEVAFGLWAIKAVFEAARYPNNPVPVSNSRLILLLIVNLPLILLVVWLFFQGFHHVIIPFLCWFYKVLICKMIPLLAKGYWSLLVK